MPSTTALDVRLELILRSTRDLRETIEGLGRFWDEFSSNIKAVPPSMMLDYRALIISSGRGRDMIKQWAVVSDLIRKFGIDRRKAVDLVLLAPPAIRSTGMGQYTGLSLWISVPFLIIDCIRIMETKTMKPVELQYYYPLSLISMSLIHSVLHPPLRKDLALMNVCRRATTRALRTRPPAASGGHPPSQSSPILLGVHPPEFR